MTASIHEVPLSERFHPEDFDLTDRSIIAGAINRYGINKLTTATPENLSVFTWEQVSQALLTSRKFCSGDALDDTDDLIYGVRDVRKHYAS